MRYITCMAACFISTAAYSQIDLNYVNRIVKGAPLTHKSSVLKKGDFKMAPPASPSLKDERPDPEHDTYSIRTLRYQHNTRTGFDVYTSPAYNMPVLIPDSANAATFRMKVLITPLIAKEKAGR